MFIIEENVRRRGLGIHIQENPKRQKVQIIRYDWDWRFKEDSLINKLINKQKWGILTVLQRLHCREVKKWY